jgi:hypothetical protein
MPVARHQVRMASALAIGIGFVLLAPVTLEFTWSALRLVGIHAGPDLADRAPALVPAALLLAGIGSASLLATGPDPHLPALVALLPPVLAAIATAWVIRAEGLAVLGGTLLMQLAAILTVATAGWAFLRVPGELDSRLVRRVLVVAGVLLAAGLVLGGLAATLVDGRGPGLEPEAVGRDAFLLSVFPVQLMLAGLAFAHTRETLRSNRRAAT